MNTTPTVHVSILIQASIEDIWDALVNPVTVKKYFFNTDMETDWVVGNPIYFRGEWEGKPYEDKGVVVSYIPMQSLSYTHKSSVENKPDVPENYNLVTYTVMQKDAGVELSISQTAQNEDSVAHSEVMWNTLLGEIKKLLEKSS
jgi:uncharacterized protein YndB with AHSA1/START domain